VVKWCQQKKKSTDNSYISVENVDIIIGSILYSTTQANCIAYLPVK